MIFLGQSFFVSILKMYVVHNHSTQHEPQRCAHTTYPALNQCRCVNTLVLAFIPSYSPLQTLQSTSLSDALFCCVGVLACYRHPEGNNCCAEGGIIVFCSVSLSYRALTEACKRGGRENRKSNSLLPPEVLHCSFFFSSSSSFLFF